LVDKKADVSIRTEEGIGNDSTYSNKTAKKIAELRNHKECAKIIKNYKMIASAKKVIKTVVEIAK